jgi:putative flippase GtrA
MHQVRKFLYLGVLTTLIDYLIYSILIFLGFNYVFAIFIGYSVGLFVNYEVGRRYIFISGRKVSSSHVEFVTVVAIAIGGMLLNMAVVKLLSYGIWSFDPLLSRMIAIGVTFIWNFVLRKLFVYH